MSGESILIVEDDGILATSFKTVLSGFGYGIFAAVATGEEAVELARNRIPDLILMDIELAGELNGIDTAEIVRSFSDVPVVFLTAYTQEHLIQQAKFTAPAAYLVKPVRAPELHANIEMALYRHMLDRKLKESEKRYRSLVEFTPEALVIVFDNRIVFVNQAAVRLFGALSADKLVGKSMGDLFYPEHHASVRDWVTIINAGEPGTLLKVKIQRMDGSIADVEVAAASFETGEGTVIQLIPLSNSDRKRSELERCATEAFREGTGHAFKKPASGEELRKSIDAMLRLRHFSQEKRMYHSSFNRQDPQEIPYLPSHIPENISRSIAFIEKNLTSPINLDQISRQACMSKFHFCRIFKKYIGATPMQYIINLRLREAATLLKRKDLKICDIALKSGFNDLSEFNKQFKKLYGSPPSSFREAT